MMTFFPSPIANICFDIISLNLLVYLLVSEDQSLSFSESVFVNLSNIVAMFYRLTKIHRDRTKSDIE